MWQCVLYVACFVWRDRRAVVAFHAASPAAGFEVAAKALVKAVGRDERVADLYEGDAFLVFHH